MQVTKRCHIVPQFFLQRFSGDDQNKIAVYDRANQFDPLKPNESISSTAILLYYYVLQEGSLLGDQFLPDNALLKNKTVQLIEQELGKIEDHCKTAFKKIDRGSFSDDVLKAVALFIWIQFRRVPKDLNDYYFWKMMGNRTSLAAHEIFNNNYEKLLMYQSLKELAPLFVLSALKGEWKIVKTTEAEFILSDNPVYVSMGHNSELILKIFETQSDYFFAQELAMYTYYLPMSPNKMLILKPSEDIKNDVKAKVEEFTINKDSVLSFNEEYSRFSYERIYAKNIETLKPIMEKYNAGTLKVNWGNKVA